MKYFDTMCYGMEDPTIEEVLAAEGIDFEDYVDAMYEDEMYEEMAAKHDVELAYEGGYCG
jgi:hypothetical protein